MMRDDRMVTVSEAPRLLQFGDRVEVPGRGAGTVAAVDLGGCGPEDEPRFDVELDAGGTVTVAAGDVELLEAGEASIFAGELLDAEVF